MTRSWPLDYASTPPCRGRQRTRAGGDTRGDFPLLDLCLENAARDCPAPDLLTTRQLAVKIVELYWPHTRPWATGALRQSSGPGGGQAEIVAAIGKFRAAAASDGSTPLAEALARTPARYRRLVDFVEWKLIEMPLPRLQTIGDESVTFLRARRGSPPRAPYPPGDAAA